MKISTSAHGVINVCGFDDAMRILADTGFEAIDYSITQATIDWDDDFFRQTSSPAFAEHFRSIGKAVRSYGLEMYQCHAPWAPTYISDPRLYRMLERHVSQSIYAAAYMECPNIVAHPVLRSDFCCGKNKEIARKATLDHFAAMVPALRDTGVTMCIENLYFCMVRGQPRLASFGSDAEELCDIIDTLNDMYGPHFAACLDTGHAALIQRDPSEMLKVLGSRLRTLHIHDNDGLNDNHVIPTRGVLDWKKFAEALGEIDYQGTFNFEVFAHFAEFSGDMYSRATFRQACDLLYGIGRSLTDIAEGKR